MFPPFMRAFDLMIWLKWALSELHLPIHNGRFEIGVMITTNFTGLHRNPSSDDQGTS